MLLTNSFSVPVPIERAWSTLLDMERVAPCLPGATVGSFDGEVCEGRVKVKLGPIALQYRGEVTIDERDNAAHALKMTGVGKEMNGAGAASARIRVHLVDQEGSTDVHVETELDLTGKPAQFGRGLIKDVSNRLVGTFADNLKDLLAVESDPASTLRSGADAGAVTEAAAGRPAFPVVEPAALDALTLLPAPLRRAVPFLLGLTAGLMLARLARRICRER